MLSPASVGSPITGQADKNKDSSSMVVDMQEHVKRVIELQYEQQQHMSTSTIPQGNWDVAASSLIAAAAASSSASANHPSRTVLEEDTGAVATSHHPQYQRRSVVLAEDSSSQFFPPPTPQHSEAPSRTSRQSMTSIVSAQQQQEGVGQGTLILAGELQQPKLPPNSRSTVSASSTSSATTKSTKSSLSRAAPSQHQLLGMPPIPQPPKTTTSTTTRTATSSLLEQQQQQQDQRPQQRSQAPPSYGAISSQSATAPSTVDQSSRAVNQILPPPPLPPQEHTFRYHHTDYAVDHEASNDGAYSWPNYGGRNRRSLMSRCCCLWDPLCSCLATIFCAPLSRRSFCYGAIDGMVTGASLVAAFYGSGVLDLSALPYDNYAPPSSSSGGGVGSGMTTVHPLLVLVVAAAAGWSDALCMALGHVWTTYVMVSTQTQERAAVRRRLHHRTKADAKAELVDLLLVQQGMLKIDAMSLADTLEGYPDMFVSVLTGEGLLGGNCGGEAAVGGGDDVVASTSSRTGASGQRESGSGPQPIHNQLRDPAAWDNGTVEFGYARPASSYLEFDPDARQIENSVREARNESICMMLGFSLFTVVPSIILYYLPAILNLGSSSSDDNSTHLLTTTTVNSPTTAADSLEVQRENASLVHPTTAYVLLNIFVMLFLGIWKSRFHQLSTGGPDEDGLWIMFAVEAISVLVVCLLAAASLGALLGQHVLGTSPSFWAY